MRTLSTRLVHHVSNIITYCFPALLSMPYLVAAMPADSLGLETKNGKTYIVHLVGKETLYSIARRYGVKVADLQALNPELQTGLKVGQKIYVPYTSYDTDTYVYHKVEAGQTLFGLAKLYGSTVEQLKMWNNIAENDVPVGRWIAVALKKTVSDNSVGNTPALPVAPPVQKTAASEQKPLAAEPNSKTYEESTPAKNELIKEKGKAGVYKTAQNEQFYLALHPKAAFGSLLRVTNEEKKIKLYVRVVGKPAADLISTQQAAIWLSPKAYETLQLTENAASVLIEALPEH